MTWLFSTGHIWTLPGYVVPCHLKGTKIKNKWEYHTKESQCKDQTSPFTKSKPTTIYEVWINESQSKNPITQWLVHSHIRIQTNETQSENPITQWRLQYSKNTIQHSIKHTPSNTKSGSCAIASHSKATSTWSKAKVHRFQYKNSGK
jgi:hypothetical protein